MQARTQSLLWRNLRTKTTTNKTAIAGEDESSYVVHDSPLVVLSLVRRQIPRRVAKDR